MKIRLAAIAATIALLASSGVAVAADTPEPPREVGLIERTSSRLAQIDISVSGPKSAISGLTSDDFEVSVNRKLVSEFVIDDLCVARATARPGNATPSPDVAPAAEEPTPAKPSPATYLLYFDMPHLTLSGRRGSIDAARDMLPKLLAGGNRAMIVVNATRLKTYAPLTTDAKTLDASLAKLVDDNTAFDPYASTEDNRLSDITREIERGIDFALALARRYAADERTRQERDLRRLSMILGRFTDIDSPKAVLYFSDTMRQNAGEHYLSFFGSTTLRDGNGKPVSDADAILNDAATGALPLDRVMNDAAALGIRFYTIEGQGIMGMDTFIQSRSPSTGGGGGQSASNAQAGVNSQRTRDSQATLVSLAAETGGRAFLNGVSASKMAAQILDDVSCIYLLSFDPKGFPQNAPLSVSVNIKRPGVKAVVRGRLVIESDSNRLTGRVLSAFATPEATGANEGNIRVGLIPVSYADGKFKARVQVAIPGSALPSATWDIGATVVSQGVVWQDGSGRIQVSLPNLPAVYEKDMEFAPGDYDLIAVAHEGQTDTLASKEVHGSWPKLETELVSLGPLAVSQPRPGGFLRNGASRTQGAVIVGEGEPLREDAPTAVIALVCRAKDQKRPLRVVRTLFGETETPVGTTELDLTTERCAQVLDLIPPKSLGSGVYRFVLTVTSDGKELARVERALVVPEHPPAPVKSAS